jgi:uncharacterized protein YjbI with pentapeptide repeats
VMKSKRENLMRSRKRQRWIIGSSLVGIVILVFLLTEYRLNWTWDWTGFLNKTLWDWMQLLIIPGVLAIAALLFNLTSSRNEQKITEQRYQNDQKLAIDKQREDLLQGYFDRMSELILNNHLRTSVSNDEVRNIARARTLSVLARLDASRKESLLRFLYESNLISIDDPVIQLDGADLRKVNISDTRLAKTNLRGVNLSGAMLIRTDLRGSDLREAYLNGASLYNANLSNTTLNDASLSSANLNGALLNGTNLRGTDLSEVRLIGADLSGADLSGAYAYLYYYDLQKEMNTRGIYQGEDKPNEAFLWEIYNTRYNGYMKDAIITKEQINAIKLRISYK